MSATPNDNAPQPAPRMPEARNVRPLTPEGSQNPDPVALRGGRPGQPPMPGQGSGPALAANPDQADASEAGKQAKAPGAASFFDLRHVLEQRSREWTTMVRQLEQHRHHLSALEAEQSATYEQLERIVPVVQGTYRTLKSSIEARKSGEAASEIDEVAAVNARALEELEKLAGTLSTQAVWFRSAWEQYARTVESAQRLRTQLDNPKA
ncbi:MAG TPA: hypothetical protein VGC68_09695 [Enterovirga sp.]